jgi:hypothetical protein
MPQRLEPHPHWNPLDTREELIAHATSAELSVGPVRVRAGAVPLFRDTDGDLQQAVRVRVEGPDSAGAACISVAAGEPVLDRLTLQPNDFGSSVHLFVPEVTADTSMQLCVETGSDRETAEIIVGPQRKWSIHLIHHSHFDYGYTDRQAVVMEHQLRYLDAALDLISLTDDWPEEARFRWNVEVTYPLQKWLRARPQEHRDEFIRRVKEGRIEVNALPFSMHTEVYSIDELAWGLRFADELRERYGLEIVSAIQSDVPGATIGLLNLLTSADIRYLSVAHNYAGRSVPFRVGGQELTRPFWWKGADDKRLLVWQSDTPHGVAYMDGVLVGISESEGVARGLLPDYLASLSARPYPYGKHAFGWHDLPPGLPVTKQPYPHDLLYLRVQNSLADNAPPTLALSGTVRDWNQRWTYPQLRVSTNRDFFTIAERDLGDQLDTFEGDWTDWWVDGVGSGALPLGRNRQTQGTIRTAQTLHTLASAITGAQSESVSTEIERVYEDAALFDEHTWGSANPWRDKLDMVDSGQLQWGRKSAFAYEAFDRANSLLDSGLHRFATSVSAARGALTSLVVFNPSGWTRTDIARVFIPAERLQPGTAFAVVNAAAGRTIPYGVEAQSHPGFRAKGQWVSFAATDLPPVGYVRFDIVAADSKPQSKQEPNASDPFTVESRFYRATLEPGDGFIASIMDLDSGRELVDAEAPFGFNEYIYERYTSAAGFNHLSGRIEDVDMGLFGSRSTAGNASVIARSANPIAEHITVRMAAEGADWLESTITLLNDVKRIDISNRLLKTATPEKESVFFAFPFAVDDADPEYEITGGVTSLDAPHVPGSARHMFAIRHWLGLQDRQGSATWATMEAPLIQLGTIALPYSPFLPTIPQDRSKRSTIYSWALNNLWDTNFPPAQGGEMIFRYAVSSDAELPRRELGVRTGASLSTPLVGICLRGNDGTENATGSFISVFNPLVELVTVAESRHGEGIVAYLHSLAPETVDTQIDFPALRPTRVQVGNYLERHLTDLALTQDQVTVTLTPGAYIAVVIELEAR